MDVREPLDTLNQAESPGTRDANQATSLHKGHSDVCLMRVWSSLRLGGAHLCPCSSGPQAE